MKVVMMMKKNEFEVVSHEKALEMAQENASKQFELKHEQLPTSDLKSAKRVLETIPLTNKMYYRLQEQVNKKKEKERQRKLAEQVARIQQQQEQENNGFEF